MLLSVPAVLRLLLLIQLLLLVCNLYIIIVTIFTGFTNGVMKGRTTTGIRSHVQGLATLTKKAQGPVPNEWPRAKPMGSGPIPPSHGPKAKERRNQLGLEIPCRGMPSNSR